MSSTQLPQFEKSGMDALLSQRGKAIAPGETVTFTLVKGPSGIVLKDPVNPKAPTATFPLIAKFPESVPKPDFTKPPFSKSRLYQQDTPKVKDDSDDEDAGEASTKRRWRRRPDAPKRQWILQEETEFLETMVAKRQKKEIPNHTTSSRYVGVAEHSTSSYALLTSTSDGNVRVATLSSTSTPTTTFSQPNARNAMSLSQAEQVISDQRAHMSRYMMHKKSGKSRLLDKLAASGGAEEEDDVMADVAFKNRKGGSKARKELLEGEEDIAVDDDGVLGGTNDAEFGGKRHFARLQAQGGAASGPAAAAAKKSATSTTGYDGMAMSDDFYQRDVSAEYEDLDYDANEQFEDDDVDMGEKEVHLSPTDGFAEPDTDEEDEVFEESDISGAEGLATVAGFKKLLAKSRGETADPLEASDDEKDKKGSRPSSPVEKKTKAEPTVHDPLASLKSEAERAKEAAEKEPPVKKQKVTGVELDAQGRRVLSLEAVQREIWLNHGSIPTKRITKTFGVKAKDKERYKEFVQIAKTIATFEKDELGNPILVLKQHYKKMA
jgi:hypothetical protein